MNYEDLAVEQKARALTCKTLRICSPLQRPRGYDLSDDELTQIAVASHNPSSGCDKVWEYYENEGCNSINSR